MRNPKAIHNARVVRQTPLDHAIKANRRSDADSAFAATPVFYTGPRRGPMSQHKRRMAKVRADRRDSSGASESDIQSFFNTQKGGE